MSNFTIQEAREWCAAIKGVIDARGYYNANVMFFVSSDQGGRLTVLIRAGVRPDAEYADDAMTETFCDSAEAPDPHALFVKARDAALAWPSSDKRAVQSFQRDLAELTERAERLHLEGFGEQAQKIVASLREAAEQISRNALTHSPAE